MPKRSVMSIFLHMVEHIKNTVGVSGCAQHLQTPHFQPGNGDAVLLILCVCVVTVSSL